MCGLHGGPVCVKGYVAMSDLVSQYFPPERLTAVSVLRAYRDGFFPMGCGDGRLRWFSPDPRGSCRWMDSIYRTASGACCRGWIFT